MKLLILALFILAPVLCLANQYDDEEKVRRYLDKADKQEQKERDAARQRADDAENPHDSSVGGWLCPGVVVGLFVVYIFLSFQKK